MHYYEMRLSTEMLRSAIATGLSDRDPGQKVLRHQDQVVQRDLDSKAYLKDIELDGMPYA